MNVFLLIIRIVLLLGVFAGIIVMSISGKIAKAKKFGNEKLENHFETRMKLIGFLIVSGAIALLLIISMLS